MTTVIMPRYLDTPARISQLSQTAGPLKTLASGLWTRIAAQEVVTAEEFRETCGDRYGDLVENISQPACVFAEVEQYDAGRIQS